MTDAFYQLMMLHVPQGSKVLDPTAGYHMLWGDNLSPGIFGADYEVTFSDIAGGKDNEQLNLSRARSDRPEWLDSFDAVVYDPPYFIGENEAKDPREAAYGGYAYSLQDLLEYMRLCHTVIPDLLKPKGKLIVKCSDQYVVSERKFYHHHYEWMRNILLAFEITDIMIYRHHRMSPTAFQVKDRPCGVVMHTYYLVGEKLS